MRGVPPTRCYRTFLWRVYLAFTYPTNKISSSGQSGEMNLEDRFPRGADGLSPSARTEWYSHSRIVVSWFYRILSSIDPAGEIHLANFGNWMRVRWISHWRLPCRHRARLVLCGQ